MTEKTTIGVYIKVDADGNVTAINSSVFLPDTEGWVLIDEGNGDRYAHAQSQYLSKPLTDEYGRYNFKLHDGRISEIAETDKPEAAESVSVEERISLVETAVEELILMQMGGDI